MARGKIHDCPRGTIVLGTTHTLFVLSFILEQYFNSIFLLSYSTFNVNFYVELAKYIDTNIKFYLSDYRYR